MTKKRRRPIHLHVMVSEEEQALIQQRMTESGIRNMGAYMRKMALNGYVLHVDLSPVRELVSLQRRCSNNLNQVAIQANTYGGIYPEEIAALQRDYAALWGPLSDLLKKLPGFHYFGTICPEVLKAGGILVVPPGQRYNYHVRNHKPHFSRRYQAMRIILKLLSAPFVLALTLLVAVLNFAFSFASWVFYALSFLCLIGALFALFTGDRWGIQGLVIAFAVSPFGLPAVAEWLINKLDSLNYSLKSFITG